MRSSIFWNTGIRLDPPTMSTVPMSEGPRPASSSVDTVVSSVAVTLTLISFSNSARVSSKGSGRPLPVSDVAPDSIVDSCFFSPSALP